MKILIASDFYPPFLGGAEYQVQLLGRELQDRGHSVTVATVWHEGLDSEEVDGGVRIQRIRGLATSMGWFSGTPKRRFHPPAPEPGISMGLLRLVRRERPDVIHANGWIAYSCAAASLAAKVPLVLSVRDYGYACATRTLLEKGRRISSGPELSKCLKCAAHRYGPAKALPAVLGVYAGRPLLARTVTGVHSVSRYVEMTVKRDVLKERAEGRDVIFETIPDIVPSDPYRASASPAISRAWSERLPEEPFILFVGALQAHKGLAVLLQAYAVLDKLDPTRPRPPLLLIGTRWPDTPRSVPPGVTLLEDVPHDVVMHAWRRSLLGVVPSIWPDPLPGVVREAMSQGKAVIATAVGGNLDMVVPDVTGLLVPPADVRTLAEAFKLLIHDPSLRERLGEAARLSVRDLDAPAIGGRFEQFYGAAVAAASTADRMAGR